MLLPEDFSRPIDKRGTDGCGETLDHRVLKVLQAIQENPNQSIEELAQLACLSSSRLSHLFKAATGSSLKRFLSDRQLEAAADLLQSTNLRVKEVSFYIGFSHEPSFVRAFRNKFGESPSSYRNQQRIGLRNS